MRCEIRYGNLSEESTNFLKKMLLLDPEKRHTAMMLLQDPWLLKNTKTVELDQQILLNISANL
jgi:serine/threonine protein kinase